MSTQPFEGIKVVEFGQFVAVPVAAQLLAEGGAEVIKVEPLRGDAIRFVNGPVRVESRHFISRNHGKQCLPLALTDESAKPVIDALVSWADVVLMNMRPGIAEKLGIAPAQLRKRFPRLIIGSLSPYGNSGPEAGDVGMDIVVQARSGLMAANGRMIGDRPAACETASVDTLGAAFLAFGVLSALLRRDRTGEGGIVETSLLQAALAFESTDFTRAVQRDAAEHEGMLEQLAAKRAAGASFAEQLEVTKPAEFATLMKMKNIYYTTFATQDSHFTVACGSTSLQKTFRDTIGFVDEAFTPGFKGDWDAHYTQLGPKVEALIASKTSDHWVGLLRAAGVPASKVFMPIELFDDEHFKANKLLHNYEHPSMGEMTSLSPPLSLDEDGFRPGQPTRPFGADSDKILSQLGFSSKEIDDLMAAKISHRGL